MKKNVELGIGLIDPELNLPEQYEPGEDECLFN